MTDEQSTTFTPRHILLLQKGKNLQRQGELFRTRLSAVLPDCVLHLSTGEDRIENADQIDTIITRAFPHLPEVLRECVNCKWLHFLSAGVDKVWDMPIAHSDYLITKSSGVHSAPISEYAMGAILHFAKCFPEFHIASRTHSWTRQGLSELTGQTLCILGLGHIGRALAKRAKAFDMRVVGTRRTPVETEYVDLCVSNGDVMDLLPEVDYLVVCLPMTPKTRRSVGEKLLSALKPGATVISISRGGIVDEAALLKHIDSGHIRGAALDVFETEPLPSDSPLWDHEKILVTPHLAGSSQHSSERSLDLFLKNAVQISRGLAPVTPVSLSEGY